MVAPIRHLETIGNGDATNETIWNYWWWSQYNILEIIGHGYDANGTYHQWKPSMVIKISIKPVGNHLRWWWIGDDANATFKTIGGDDCFWKLSVMVMLSLKSDWDHWRWCQCEISLTFGDDDNASVTCYRKPLVMIMIPMKPTVEFIDDDSDGNTLFRKPCGDDVMPRRHFGNHWRL